VPHIYYSSHFENNYQLKSYLVENKKHIFPTFVLSRVEGKGDTRSWIEVRGGLVEGDAPKNSRWVGKPGDMEMGGIAAPPGGGTGLGQGKSA
jgi:hypothetical protein